MSKETNTQMEHISASDLRSIPYRVAYLKKFLNFTDADGAAIQASAAILGPLLPALLDAVYSKLLAFDITAKAFAPPQPGLNDGAKAASVQELTLNHPQIAHRRDFLKQYLLKLVRVDEGGWTDTAPLWTYLDNVGVMHTGEAAGFAHRARRPQLRVEYAHLGVLLGYVEDAVVGAVMGAEAPAVAERVEMVRAWNKLLWIQNDLFARHYVVDRDSKYAPRGSTALAQAADANYPESARTAQQATKLLGPFVGGFFAVVLYLAYTKVAGS
ncbi:MAG: hypothetical protein M1821_006933 [Bathelium mastoideum]|nr:MAG: hypothetical protein M1821_006933 [Bathelium mastoideum]